MNAVIFVRANRPSEIKRQLEECSIYAKKSKLNVVEVISCASEVADNLEVFENFGKILGAYMRYQEDGGLDVVVVSSTDRVTRLKRHYKMISGVLDELGIKIQTTDGSLGAAL